jgi:hypothetical protein
MIIMKNWGIVRRLFYRDGLSISAIERRSGLIRKTISKRLRALELTEPKYHRRSSEDTKITSFAAQLSRVDPRQLSWPPRVIVANHRAVEVDLGRPSVTDAMHSSYSKRSRRRCQRLSGTALIRLSERGFDCGC